MKEQSKAVMLDFFDEPADSPRRSRPGVHGAWLFGPPEERVQVVLLDLRSFKSPWDYRTEPQLQGDGHPGGYAPKLDTTATMLGEEQWQWLSEQLRVPARVRLIGSSLQALSEECHWEGWAMMPHERERLLDTVRDSGAGGVIFLSGDTHWAELTRVDPWDSGVSYPLHELTSSGLNQAWEWTQIVNPHRVGPALFEGSGTVRTELGAGHDRLGPTRPEDHPACDDRRWAPLAPGTRPLRPATLTTPMIDFASLPRPAQYAVVFVGAGTLAVLIKAGRSSVPPRAAEGSPSPRPGCCSASERCW
ncbi:MAG: alkaline phosphatase D family protein [Planctomycetota bacterium]|jgi:hypothetical protein